MANKTSFEIIANQAMPYGRQRYDLAAYDVAGEAGRASKIKVSVLANFTAPGVLADGPCFVLVGSTIGFEPEFLTVPYDLRAAAFFRLRADVSSGDTSGNIVAAAVDSIELPDVYDGSPSPWVEVHNYCPNGQVLMNIGVHVTE